MGANQSSPLEGSTIGFHILEIEPDSAAEKAGLEVYFDYITHCNGIRLNEDPAILKDYISENRPLPLIVYSSKTMSLRMVSIVGKNLGLKVKSCSFEGAHERVWHVLEVQKDSPSFVSGLISNTDYIIGSPQRTLHRKEDFLNLVKDFKGKQLKLYVYNSELDSIRNVIIIPDLWDGDGLLGCDIAYGNLHRIALSKEPMSRDNSTSNLPGGLVTDHEHGMHRHSHASHKHSHSEHKHSHGDHSHQHHDHSHGGHSHHDHLHIEHSHHEDDHKGNHHHHSHNDHPHHVHPHEGHHHDNSHKDSRHTHHDHSHDHSKHEHSLHANSNSTDAQVIKSNDSTVNHEVKHTNADNHVHGENCNHSPGINMPSKESELPPVDTQGTKKSEIMNNISPLNQPTFAPAAIPHPSLINEGEHTPLLHVEDDYIHDISGVPSLSWSSKSK
ncbi:Golgi reassembly-stacking protein 2 [Boothiomyces macroporosus]|uniref:Golgi reassembly-stacking protein 2 n=1 Tax=Boothiomyces macroporosus TaxID=261099 RepID=A0AAD5UAR8_9FUNG|nr:Golgi reassembly-stacking protein 2 [Boothiomyces macroporosus]